MPRTALKRSICTVQNKICTFLLHVLEGHRARGGAKKPWEIRVLKNLHVLHVFSEIHTCIENKKMAQGRIFTIYDNV